jgi:4-amino-4-deoxy-L-arabinose transferase-like glycosyltransferase
MERAIEALNSDKSPFHWASFWGLLGLALILRLIVFHGYSGSDPSTYAYLANDLAHGTVHIPDINGPPVFPLRVGVYAPTAAAIKVFGLSEWTLAAYPFLVSMAACILAYSVTRRFGPPLAALVALAVFAVVPIDVSMASQLYPDAIAAFWANIGVALACVSLSRRKWSQSVLIAMLSGLSFGLAWLCKEAVVYLIPFIVIFFVVLNRQERRSVRTACLIAMGIGSIAILSTEMLSYRKLTGDPLFRLHETERDYEYSSVYVFNQSSPFLGWENGGYGRALARRLVVSGPITMLFNSQMSFAPALAILGVAWVAVFRLPSLSIPITWLSSLLLMFNFMTSSFRSYKPLPPFDRYLHPILLPSAILMGCFLAMLLTTQSNSRLRAERSFWALLLILGFLGLSARGVWNDYSNRRDKAERLVAKRLRPNDVVYTDLVSAANLVFFRTGLLLPSDKTTIAWEAREPSQVSHGDYVFVDRDVTDYIAQESGYKSRFLEPIPSSWKPVWTSGRATLYVVNDR